MAHTHSVIDDDLSFIIDPSTREIGNGSQKVKLMQYDHNSEQFTFEIPRFVEGHDMSLCNSIRVNYININKSNREQHPGVYEVSDIKVEEDNIIFSWLVSRNATQYVGPLNFLIKFMCFDENDYITYEWHTDIFKSASVSTGMNNEESIEEVYPDILEKWKNDVLAAEASRITAESERVAAESERASAESERASAESERASAESERATAESERATAESERATAESERATAESERATAESERVAAESERVTAESERVTAESERATAESERANTFAGYETEINQFKNEIVTGKDSATDNTKFAIGEAEPNLEVPTMEEFNQLADDMTGKLSEPAEGLAVGKYFRVAALDENGHAVLEAVDAKTVGVQDVQVAGASVVADGVANVPLAKNAPAGTQAKYGLVALGDNLNYGLTLAHDAGHNADVLTLSTPSQITIDNRNKTYWLSVKYAPLMASNLDYAVKAAMCDGKGDAWTTDEQAAARERIGIPGDYELIASVELTEDAKIDLNITTDTNGNVFSLKSIIINAVFMPTETNTNFYIYKNNDEGRLEKIFHSSSIWDTVDKTYFTIKISKYGERYYKSGSCYKYSNYLYDFGQYRAFNPMRLCNATGTAEAVSGALINIINLSSGITCPAGCKFDVYGVRA